MIVVGLPYATTNDNRECFRVYGSSHLLCISSYASPRAKQSISCNNITTSQLCAFHDAALHNAEHSKMWCFVPLDYEWNALAKSKLLMVSFTVL
mmetsp:Transcript_33715/g.49163  ORF Transcript_33715/g.49163 Transcript_33715/m.49163 type:complete len:94 (+) Transcript_33715:78-359(+)